MMATPVEKFAKAVDTDRLRRDFLDLFEEEPLSRMRDWADSLAEVADAIDTAKENVEEWATADDNGLTRDERADAKERALTSLEELINLWDQSPLDLDKLEDWTEDQPEVEDKP